MSKILLAYHQLISTASQSTELVNKNKTSAAQSLKKRKKAARKKLKKAFKEQKRYAREKNLRAVALTLTYIDNKKFKSRHISKFLDQLRHALKRKGHSLPYGWTLECDNQLHYHVILWLPRDYKLDPDKLKKWWPWGSTWTKSCNSPTAWGRYITKFDSTQNLPKGSRLFGYGGLDANGKVAVHRAGLPKWLSLLLPATELAKKVAGGGWVNVETGERYRSPYIWTPRGIVLRQATRLACHPTA